LSLIPGTTLPDTGKHVATLVSISATALINMSYVDPNQYGCIDPLIKMDATSLNSIPVVTPVSMSTITLISLSATAPNWY